MIHPAFVTQVHVVGLQLSKEEAARRHAAAAAAAAAGLEVADLGAEASQGLLGEASFMPPLPSPGKVSSAVNSRACWLLCELHGDWVALTATSTPRQRT